MIRRLFAFLTRRQLVWLRDHDGQLTLSVMYRYPFGDYVGVCYRHWPYKSIGAPVLLNADGTCVHTYVSEWVKA